MYIYTEQLTEFLEAQESLISKLCDIIPRRTLQFPSLTIYVLFLFPTSLHILHQSWFNVIVIYHPLHYVSYIMQNIIILSTQRKPLEFHFPHQSSPRTNSVSTPYHLPMVLPNTSVVGTPLTQIVFPHRRPNVHLAVCRDTHV